MDKEIGNKAYTIIHDLTRGVFHHEDENPLQLSELIELDYLSGPNESHLSSSGEDSYAKMWGTLVSPSENDPSSPKSRKDVVHHTHDMYMKVFCDNNQGKCKYGRVYFNGCNFLGSPLKLLRLRMGTVMTIDWSMRATIQGGHMRI